MLLFNVICCCLSYLNKIKERITYGSDVHFAFLQCRIEFVLVKVSKTMHIAEYMVFLAAQTAWQFFVVEYTHIVLDARS